MFILQESPIDPIKVKSTFPNAGHGAFVSFEGVVRADKNDTSSVAALMYLANNQECMTQGECIVAEATYLFPITHALCIQRIGQVQVGEIATWIGVWSPHRDEAFKGCRYIIEETKKRLLIWKKEFNQDGTNQWIKGAETPVIL